MGTCCDVVIGCKVEEKRSTRSAI
ncbi:hypothetical protein A2U01_0113125, partial [Trifolium medium]|nr:hypothetical protein [Trifolium medium]